MRTRILIVHAGAMISLAGCLVSVGPLSFDGGSNGRRGEPLPEAPTHGEAYRHPADGIELVFDGELGVYVVPELPGHYFHEGTYHRQDASGWAHSTHLDGPWRHTEPDGLPLGLR